MDRRKLQERIKTNTIWLSFFQVILLLSLRPNSADRRDLLDTNETDTHYLEVRTATVLSFTHINNLKYLSRRSLIYTLNYQLISSTLLFILETPKKYSIRIECESKQRERHNIRIISNHTKRNIPLLSALY